MRNAVAAVFAAAALLACAPGASAQHCCGHAPACRDTHQHCDTCAPAIDTACLGGLWNISADIPGTRFNGVLSLTPPAGSSASSRPLLNVGARIVTRAGADFGTFIYNAASGRVGRLRLPASPQQGLMLAIWSEAMESFLRAIDGHDQYAPDPNPDNRRQEVVPRGIADGNREKMTVTVGDSRFTFSLRPGGNAL